MARMRRKFADRDLTSGFTRDVPQMGRDLSGIMNPNLTGPAVGNTAGRGRGTYTKTPRGSYQFSPVGITRRPTLPPEMYEHMVGQNEGTINPFIIPKEDEERQMAELIMKGNPALTQGSNWNWVPGINYDVPSAGAKGLDAIMGLYNNPNIGKTFRSFVGSVPGNTGDPGMSIEDIMGTVPYGKYKDAFKDVQGIGGFQNPQDVYDQMMYMLQNKGTV